ncbi:MAG: polyhydroxyalkanoate synthesis regulator DNA-binding domain-containing protein [Anaerolineales bacterium]|nr:polyhydroxyalkanoate synthesis regulator DNA-binding domain-containing protein [Anaerolineales bacterium]
MPIIKRYANRKLYDTEAKRYVTLDGIAELIRRGAEVHVVDHASGDDITAQIQAQIIYEEEKRSGGVLPRTLLTDLIQTGSQKLNELRQVLAPEHAAPNVDAEIERRVTWLMERGDLSEKDGLRLLDLLLAAGQAPEFTDAEVERIIRERSLPSRKDLERITRRVDALQSEIDQLLHGRPKS